MPRVDAVAARDASDKVWMALVNVDPNRPASFAASVEGLRPSQAKGELLTASAVDAHNNFDRPDAVAPRPFAGRVAGGQLRFDLPPKSIAVVQVQ